ncbi:MAG: hypothetical protein JWR44_3792 [Hymenobacter sp.]|jgi:hypothetical protein|nr:hypothetical protein [Hymenobacter sp.]
MKHWYTLLLVAFALTAQAQVVQSTGAANVPLNWQPAAATDSLLVDVSGDGWPDIVFKSTNTPPTGQGMPSFTNFTASLKAGSGMAIAIDANEFDSVHRFVAGDPIGPGLLWQNGGGYLAYTVTGNGGTGGRGFFRFNADGFIVIRKNVGSQMRYWWFYIGPRSAPGAEWVLYYAGTSMALAATAAVPAAPLLAFPNPSADHLTLSRPATYQLFDSQGRLLRSSPTTPVSVIEVGGLPSGSYQLITHGTDGNSTRQQILHP